MCSTPKGSGLITQVRRVREPGGNDDYCAMLRRASQRFEARQKARQQGRRGGNGGEGER